MLILSPRAVARLESYKPAWPLPKIFRMTKGGKLNEGIFEGETINTPSMLCVEDYLDTLQWAKSIGGLDGADRARRRQHQGDRRLGGEDAVGRVPRARCRRSAPTRRSASRSSIRRLRRCRPMRRRRSPRAWSPPSRRKAPATTSAHYRDAPPGLRIWCGATVEPRDVETLTQWLDWAFAHAKDALPKAA